VPVRVSASQEVRRLVAELVELRPAGEAGREAAIARLAVIGPRAVRQLVEAFDATPAVEPRLLILRALEGIPDPRVLQTISRGLEAPAPEVRAAAARAARAVLPEPESVELLDRLIGLAVSEQQPDEVRTAAVESLMTLPPATVRPLIDRLREQGSPAVQSALDRAPAVIDPLGELEEAADGWLPREPRLLASLLSEVGATAPLSTLHRLIEIVRTRETEGRSSRRREWRSVRSSLHLALAKRNSRVALYDLREMTATAEGPLPPDCVAAISLIGDRSCLEPLTVAYLRAEQVADGEAWRRELAEAVGAIARREGITRRHGVSRRIIAKYGAAAEPLLAALPASSSGSAVSRPSRSGRR
jgi:HEAT repeat protein